MTKRDGPREYEGKRAGFVYLATNPAMPGFVKVGRTQKWPFERIKELYSTGVPEPFVCEGAKFFVDCYTAEDKVLEECASVGARCNNREFFKIELALAKSILDMSFRTQNNLSNIYCFRTQARYAFELALVSKPPEWIELIVATLQCLPFNERERDLYNMLAITLETGSQDHAIELIRNWGLDPDVPLDLYALNKEIDLYSLTVYELSILLGYEQLEQYLGTIGCNVWDTKALCWVIDCLTMENRGDAWKRTIADFGISLLKRGANIQRILCVDLFAGSPRKRRPAPFRYDIFPRNSGKTCAEVIIMLSSRDQHFAELNDVMGSLTE